MRNHNAFPADDGSSDEQPFPIDPEEEQILQQWENPSDLEQRVSEYLGEPEIDIEDTSEDVLEGIAQEIGTRLSLYGVEGLDRVDPKEFVELWHEMDMSHYLLDDLVFYVLDDKQKVIGNSYVSINFTELRERSSCVSNNPYVIRHHIVEKIAPNLVNILGFNESQAYKWSQNQANEDRAQAIRRLGWLIEQPFMKSFPHTIRQMEADANRRLKIPEILSEATREVVRKLVVHRKNVEQRKNISRISYEIEHYEQMEKSMINAAKMCNISFTGTYKKTL